MMFTREDVIEEARKKNNGEPVCIYFLDDAMRESTLEEAVDVILIDTYYWDHSPF